MEWVKETKPAHLLIGKGHRSYSTERVIEPLISSFGTVAQYLRATLPIVLRNVADS